MPSLSGESERSTSSISIVRRPESSRRTSMAGEDTEAIWTGCRHRRSRCSSVVVFPDPGTGESSSRRAVV